jgi:hypothetical protein
MSEYSAAWDGLRYYLFLDRSTLVSRHGYEWYDQDGKRVILPAGTIVTMNEGPYDGECRCQELTPIDLPPFM